MLHQRLRGAILEAAHIRPYANVASNRGSNGLLLRSDLHALFDAHQRAIHPDTRTVFLGMEPCEWPEYDRLHEKVKLAEPHGGFEASAPEKEILRERWARFRKAQGRS